MRILIAEDDHVSRSVLQRSLQSWGHEVVVTCDGLAAWQTLQSDDAPKLAILDWMMPELDGAEVCRRVRALNRPDPAYLILLSAKQQKGDVVAGLVSGANDYVTKPFDRRELQSRVRVGERMLALQHDLTGKIRDLQSSLDQIKQLQGMLPICSYCKSIRNDHDYWQNLESYLAAHGDVCFSHGVCPDCYDQIIAPEMIAAGIAVDREEQPSLGRETPTTHSLE